MTAVAKETERFNRLSATWWNATGPMRPLHVINDMRLAYVCGQIEARFAGVRRASLSGLRILDIGCGAGLPCEPLARRGAQVAGIDAAECATCRSCIAPPGPATPRSTASRRTRGLLPRRAFPEWRLRP